MCKRSGKCHFQTLFFSPPFDGETVQVVISFPIIGWLCVSVGLFAARGSETELQFVWRLEIAAVLYLNFGRGGELARHEK